MHRKPEDENGDSERPAEEREPYTRPVIEKFPPMSDVTFGTNIQPQVALTLN